MLFGTVVDDLIIISRLIHSKKSCNNRVNQCCYPTGHVECDRGAGIEKSHMYETQRETNPDQFSNHSTSMIV